MPSRMLPLTSTYAKMPIVNVAAISNTKVTLISTIFCGLASCLFFGTLVYEGDNSEFNRSKFSSKSRSRAEDDGIELSTHWERRPNAIYPSK